MKTIRAHEAHNDDNAIETVINGRRNLGIIGLTHNSLTNDYDINYPYCMSYFISLEDFRNRQIENILT